MIVSIIIEGMCKQHVGKFSSSPETMLSENTVTVTHHEILQFCEVFMIQSIVNDFHSSERD